MLRAHRASPSVGKALRRRAAALDASHLEVRARAELSAWSAATAPARPRCIKCLLDFCEPDRGEIEIFGVPHQLTHARRELAFLPERFNPPLLPDRPRFPALHAELHGTRLRRAARRADASSGSIWMPRRSTSPVRAYSKGMTQKLGSRRASRRGKTSTCSTSRPAASTRRRARCSSASCATLRDAGRTVFFTSHALADVEEICDRMAVLHEGGCALPVRPRQLHARSTARARPGAGVSRVHRRAGRRHESTVHRALSGTIAAIP